VAINETDHRIWLRNKGFIRGEDGSYSKVAAPVVAESCTSKPEQNAGHRTLATPKAQTEGPRRRLLRFTAFRTRLVDPDNNVFKWECDALRYAGIIEGDTADHVEIVTKQVKVKTKSEEGTLIEIIEGIL
jgi:hypothetical protein